MSHCFIHCPSRPKTGIQLPMTLFLTCDQLPSPKLALHRIHVVDSSSPSRERGRWETTQSLSTLGCSDVVCLPCFLKPPPKHFYAKLNRTEASFPKSFEMVLVFQMQENNALHLLRNISSATFSLISLLN